MNLGSDYDQTIAPREPRIVPRQDRQPTTDRALREVAKPITNHIREHLALHFAR